MTNIAVAQRTTLSTVDSRPQPPEAASENRLKAALEHARRLTEMYGSQRVEVAIAWETVEDLQTAQSRQLKRNPVFSCESAFNRYCIETPCALECRVYDC
ncbi:MAG: CP12 domain-containing protein [Phormidesmis sp.]